MYVANLVKCFLFLQIIHSLVGSTISFVSTCFFIIRHSYGAVLYKMQLSCTVIKFPWCSVKVSGMQLIAGLMMGAG